LHLPVDHKIEEDYKRLSRNTIFFRNTLLGIYWQNYDNGPYSPVIASWLSIWVINTVHTTYGIETNTGLKHAAMSIAQSQNATPGYINAIKISDTVWAAIIGAIIGFAATLIVRILDWRNRPLVSIKEETNDVYNQEQKTFSTKIRVENKGKTAAKNCKASLRLNNNDTKVAWENPEADFTITINAGDWEYIELCKFDYNHCRRSIMSERGIDRGEEFGPKLIIATLVVTASNAKTMQQEKLDCFDA
jgi:hypothetical protein